MTFYIVIAMVLSHGLSPFSSQVQTSLHRVGVLKRATVKTLMSLEAWVLEFTQHHSHHILPVKARHKTSPDSKSGQVDSTS